MKLTEQQARELIENCGNDDVYYRHYNRGDAIYVEFFAHLGKFISQENIPTQIAELEHKSNINEYTSVLVIKNGKAKVFENHFDKTLENNVNKFLAEKIKEDEGRNQ